MDMNALNKLKTCNSRSDIAELLDVTTQHLTYVLYNNSQNNYKRLEIKKKTGGIREIYAPNKELKKLQKNLSVLLEECLQQIEKTNFTNKTYSPALFLSHGFRKKIITPNTKVYTKITLNTYSNAYKHKSKKYILNVDLQDFFHSITFNRIVGFFCKNEHFLLKKNISIILAQLATYRPNTLEEGFLPQGSPSSPIISNLIGSILDQRLNKLAKEYDCTYTRYADDLTFSTNIKTFPAQLYDQKTEEIGKVLRKKIENTWFKINTKKTRFTNHNNKQEVTGLVVNKKVNIDKNYYRYTRSMVNKYCQTGEYFKSTKHNKPEINNTKALSGIVSYIYTIKVGHLPQTKGSRLYHELNAIEKLYLKFHFYSYFIFNEKPNIVCEGKTDPLHLHNALKYLNIKSDFNIKSLPEFTALRKTLNISGGAPSMKKFIIDTSQEIFSDKIINILHPTIFVVDGDDEGKTVINASTNKFSSTSISIKNNDGYEVFFLKCNIYIIKLPKSYVIEDFYEKDIKSTVINSKTYNPSNNSFDTKKYYGKIDLIEKVIKPKKDKICFKNFEKFFNIIQKIEEDYRSRIKRT